MPTSPCKRFRCNAFYPRNSFLVPSWRSLATLKISSHNQSDFMSVAQAVSSHKRKRSSEETGGADDGPSHSGKRPRVDKSASQARRAAPDRFWNTLSKVWLIPRALQEFDRRSAADRPEQRCVPYLDCSPGRGSCIDISHLSAASLKDLNRFARRGGPTLLDLRGVSQATVWDQQILTRFSPVRRTITSVFYGHELSQLQLPRPKAVKQLKQSFLHLGPDSQIVGLRSRLRTKVQSSWFT